MRACTAIIALLAFMASMGAGRALGGPSEVEIDGLSGTLLLPEGPAPFPAVLILAGSGPVGRDGNLPGARNDSLKLLAEGLAEHGVASLRTDKRGIGRSAPAHESDLRFTTYVEDAVRWIEVLRSDPRIGPIFLLGHSEGALVATLAAQRFDVSGLILIAGAGKPPPQIIARQLAAAELTAELQAVSRRIAESLVRGQLVDEVPPELSALYRPSVQPYLISWFALDPARELARVNMPVLIAQGTTDLQIEGHDAQKLFAAARRGQLELIDGMNHVLKDAPRERTANLATYARQDPVSAALVAAIVRFMAPMVP
jgi:alpha-beta hydrolase superfamily lysophospholipase